MDEVKEKVRQILRHDVWEQIKTVKDFEDSYGGKNMAHLYMMLREMKDNLFHIWEQYDEEK